LKDPDGHCFIALQHSTLWAGSGRSLQPLKSLSKSVKGTFAAFCLQSAQVVEDKVGRVIYRLQQLH
jgi:hypothetical protein